MKYARIAKKKKQNANTELLQTSNQFAECVIAV